MTNVGTKAKPDNSSNRLGGKDINRRQALAGGVAVGITAPGVVLASDTELHALESQWRVVREAEKQAGHEFDAGSEAAGFRAGDLCRQMNLIEDRITATPAGTLDGMLIKARFYLRSLLLSFPDLTKDQIDNIDNTLGLGPCELAGIQIERLDCDAEAAVSLIRDIARMAS